MDVQVYRGRATKQNRHTISNMPDFQFGISAFSVPSNFK